ncbi:MAG: hypothetical protein WBY53_13725 [Acidobacteriaceae bacterium]
MSRSVFLPVILCAASVAPMVMMAQGDGTDGPPNVLVIQREFVKPGKGGMMHQKTEGAFVQALKANHLDIHYLAMTSLTGQDRAVFMNGYATYADWEAETKSTMKNAATEAALEHANVADGDLLSETDTSVWERRDNLSLNNHGLTGDRYMELIVYSIKPGHDAEWDAEVKMVKAGYEKGVPDASWTMFESRFGVNGHEYLIVIPMKSLGMIDVMMSSDKAFEDAMGMDGLKKLSELNAACVETSKENLFAFSPRMSNPPEAWVKAEPDFWAPKKMTPMKKEEKKETMKPM